APERGDRPSTLHRLAFGRAAAQPVGQVLARRSEIQADGIDAVTLAGRRRAVGEDMTLMSAATSAHDLGSGHAVARIADGSKVAFGEWLGEARPAGAALELGAAVEQRQPAQAAGEHAGPLLMEERAAEGGFSTMLEEHMALLVIESGD